jgi:hypothetical protein
MRRLVLLAVSVAFAGCRHSEIVPGMDDSTFVHVMVDLRAVPIPSAVDSLLRARSRDSILRAYRVTAAQLESAAVVLSHQPGRAARIWQAIEQRHGLTLP